MELSDLEAGLKAVSSAGHVLNWQELTVLQAGLTLLKSQEKYSEILFWGKIFGSSADSCKPSSDYYIAYGVRETEFEFPSKDFFYACEDFEFKALPRLSEEAADRIIEMALEKPFSGTSAAPLEPREGNDAPEGGQVPSEALDQLTEIDRLAQAVQEIDFDTAAVPKGAHALNEAHVVVPSADFKGLDVSEATSISKYMHFRPPTSVACLRALARTDTEFYSSFLDSLDSDLPKGCWAVRQDPSALLVTLRSLSWPGYVAFHVPGTTKYGGVYFGYGQKNRDLPFIL